MILDLADGNPQYHGAGTTVVLALLVNHRLYIAGVGDSRAYLVRGGAIERLTIDDTWPDVIYHMGQISADEARVHSMRNRLLFALGMRDFEAGREEVRTLDVYCEDRFLLASDGLTDIVREEELLRIIRDNENPQAAADLLVQRAVAKGGGDDATCVYCNVGCEADDRRPPRGGGVWRRVAAIGFIGWRNSMKVPSTTSVVASTPQPADDRPGRIRKRTGKSQRGIPAKLINTVCRRLERDLRVRRTLPGKGRLHIDRQLPFLCVYRRPTEQEDAATAQLVKGEAAYLIAPAAAKYRRDVAALVHELVRTLSAKFGAFLIVEIWAAPDGGRANDPSVPSVLPTFTIHAAPTGLMRTIETLDRQLRRVKVLKQGVHVEIARDGQCHPSYARPLLTKAEVTEFNCSSLGIAVPPVYRKANTTTEFPLLLRALRHQLSLALRQVYFQFTRLRTKHRPKHYHALGRRAVVKAVWDVDRQLASVSNQFDYLLQLTPVNSTAAWRQFRRGRFERAPEFHYRPLPVDPTALKRDLYKVPIERVEDPVLQRLFQEKQEELELKLTMLRDRDTPRFLYESLQLFGGVNDELFELAKDLLNKLSGRGRCEKGAPLNAESFAQRCEEEFACYRQVCPGFKARTQVRSDVNGMIVTRGKLLINSEVHLSPTRVSALLAHEVGTHLLTYYNGRQQPFQQLYTGLAGYEELQEGLAVLSEYLAGGLNRSRMRQLAARVAAVRHLVDGASFVDTFRALNGDYGLTQRAAYNVTMRVYRGGGLTKDAVYLRGLVQILHYVQKGGDLKPLLVGKVAIEHIPIVAELRHRKVLSPPPLVPRYLLDESSRERLRQLQKTTKTVADLAAV